MTIPKKAIPVVTVLAALAGCFRPQQATHSLMVCTQMTAEQSNLVGNTVIGTLSKPGDILYVGHREIDVSEVDPDVNLFPPDFLAKVRRDGETQIVMAALSLKRRGYMVNLFGAETKVRAELLAIRLREATGNSYVFIFPSNGVNSDLCETMQEQATS